MQPLIGFAGKARSGKDTAARILFRSYGYTRIAFADPIRDGIKAAFGLQTRHFHTEEKEKVIPEIGYSPRYLMQTFGTEYGRNVLRPSIWVDLFERNYRYQNSLGRRVVVTDVRFQNEVDRIQELGGIVVYIKRPDVEAVNPHSSEQNITAESCDLTLHNDGTIHDLEQRALQIIHGHDFDRAHRAVHSSVENPC